MKSIIIKTAACVAILLSTMLTSCDKNATESPYETDGATYNGTMRISLYVPDRRIENDPLSKDSCLDTTSVEGLLTFTIDTNEKLSVKIAQEDSCAFAIPFLTEDGTVRTAFANGYLAKLYNSLKRASEEGKLPEETFQRFQSQITVLYDTIYVEQLATNDLPFRWTGALLQSWDNEENSAYTPFTMEDYTFSRKSNLINALTDMKQELAALNEAGFFTAEEQSTLKALREQSNGSTVKNSAGNCIFIYANGETNVNVRIKSGTGLLDSIAYALFGKAKDGTPAKSIWMVVNFVGSAYKASEIEIVK